MLDKCKFVRDQKITGCCTFGKVYCNGSEHRTLIFNDNYKKISLQSRLIINRKENRIPPEKNGMNVKCAHACLKYILTYSFILV